MYSTYICTLAIALIVGGLAYYWGYADGHGKGELKGMEITAQEYARAFRTMRNRLSEYETESVLMQDTINSLRGGDEE